VPSIPGLPHSKFAIVNGQLIQRFKQTVFSMKNQIRYESTTVAKAKI